eukprot:gene16817-22301_t
MGGHGGHGNNEERHAGYGWLIFCALGMITTLTLYGVALFMGGGSSTRKPGGGTDTTLIGAIMLSVSLCFDGATGAYEDKLMANDHVEPFDLMFSIQLGKSVLSFCALVATNGIPVFIRTVTEGGLMLVLLGFTGALGQVFVFVTIAKFGALNCALIGLFRKILSLLLSFILYGHHLNAIQTVGLTLSLAAMIANFYEKGGGKKHGDKGVTNEDKHEAKPEEKKSLLDEIDEPDGLEMDGMNEKSKSSNKINEKTADLLDLENQK